MLVLLRTSYCLRSSLVKKSMANLFLQHRLTMLCLCICSIQVNGFSKSHAMTGYRLGYVAAPPIITKVGRGSGGRSRRLCGPGGVGCCFLSPITAAACAVCWQQARC